MKILCLILGFILLCFSDSLIATIAAIVCFIIAVKIDMKSNKKPTKVERISPYVYPGLPKR